MKKALLCVLIALLSPQNASPSLQLKGFIEIPEKEAGPIEFTVRHLGKTGQNDKDGFYTIPISDITLHKKPSFMICKKEFGLVEGKNTINTLAFNNDKAYRYFEESTDGEWKEKKLSNSAIPTNCVMLVMDPRLVASVTTWDMELGNNFIKLPKVAIKNDVTKQDLQKASDKSLLYTCDLNRFHEKIQNEKDEKKIRNGITEISLVY